MFFSRGRDAKARPRRRRSSPPGTMTAETVKFPWENDGKTMGKLWDDLKIHGKIMGSWWYPMGTLWETRWRIGWYGKIMENHGDVMGKTGGNLPTSPWSIGQVPPTPSNASKKPHVCPWFPPWFLWKQTPETLLIESQSGWNTYLFFT